MGITENAAYLKGLAEGLKVDESTNEGKLILKMLEVIEEMAEKIEVLESANEELYAYVEEMAEDLVNLEDAFYEVEESDDDYSDLNEDYEETEYVDEEYYEVECPTCGEKICFTDEFDLDNFLCRSITYHVGVQALSNLALNAIEGTTANEEDVLGIHRNHLLVWMLTTTLRRDINHRSF